MPTFLSIPRPLYSRSLLSSIPKSNVRHPGVESNGLFIGHTDLRVHFPVKSGLLKRVSKDT